VSVQINYCKHGDHPGCCVRCENERLRAHNQQLIFQATEGIEHRSITQTTEADLGEPNMTHPFRVGRILDENAQLLEENERLRDALKPFAALAREFCVDEREPHEVVTHAVVHAGDLLEAFNAINK
jgi:regulator of replication initiation timing